MAANEEQALDVLVNLVDNSSMTITQLKKKYKAHVHHALNEGYHQDLNVWAGITGMTYLYFVNRNVTTDIYLNLLCGDIVPDLSCKRERLTISNSCDWVGYCQAALYYYIKFDVNVD